MKFILNSCHRLLNRFSLPRQMAVGSIRMNSKVANASDKDIKENRQKIRSKLPRKDKDKEFFDDAFYHEQLSRLNIIKKGDNVVDNYVDEPIVEENENVLQNHSITPEEMNILANYIYIDDNGKIRIDKEKLDVSNENNVDIILKFICVYLANFVPDKDDYERSLMNLILSSSCAK